MKMKWLWFVVAAACLFVLGRSTVTSENANPRPGFEYATIWWDGTDNSRLMRPDGSVENLAALFRQAKCPKETDDRNFYLNYALNSMAKEGWEFVGTLNKDIIVRRSLVR